MSNDEAKKQADRIRLIADLRAAKVELLSAQCATDRIRLQYSVQDIVSFGERQILRRAIASADALNDFYSEIRTHMERAQGQSELDQNE
jgi:hypothetical protein